MQMKVYKPPHLQRSFDQLTDLLIDLASLGGNRLGFLLHLSDKRFIGDRSQVNADVVAGAVDGRHPHQTGNAGIGDRIGVAFLAAGGNRDTAIIQPRNLEGSI